MSGEAAADLDTNPVGLAFIGLGWWGGELARAAARSGATRVVSGFARSDDAREDFAAEHGGRAAATLDDVLTDDGVEGLVLATPHSTHLPLIRAAADAGKHVLVEKPLAVVHREAAEAVAAARAAGIVLQVGHHRRKLAATRAIRRRIDEDQIGLLHLVEATMTTPSDQTPRGGWRGDPEECPLGGMTALGVHMVDNIHYLAGRVGEVYAVTRRLLARGALDDITTLTLELETGAVATLSTSVVLPRTATIGVYGHDGSAWSEKDGAELYVQPVAERTRARVDVPPTDALAEQMREFARCIRTGDDPEVAGEQGSEVVAVLEAAGLSARNRRPVAVSDVREGRLSLV